ncbi:MAG: response regulator [Colwelliaceae bacterium]|nr:response regulator [Colwelliaceae bacterium]
MFKNLKHQLSLILLLIFVVFLVQGYIANNSYQALLNGLKQTQQLSLEVVNVKSLEQQVTDLQRNVLLYRETGSNSVTTRFNTLINNVDVGVSKLTTYAKNNESADKYLSLINNMESHLRDYQNHFIEVKQLNARRETLFNQQTQEYITHIKQSIEPKINNAKLNADIKKSYFNLYNDIRELEYLNYQYYMSQDALIISRYQSKLSSTEQALRKIGDPELATTAKQLKTVSFRLVQLTRNYSYLVNVVMSGSANEFFYLAGKLSELVLNDLEEGSALLDKQSQQTQRYNNYLFILGLIILISLVLLILKRLILPIEKLTTIFESLAANKPITDTLTVQRNDEVGKLYSAAAAFNEKNGQTQQLLKDAQQLNEQLSETTERANKATQSKSIFLANMSHEIRTPMNGIVGMLDLLQRTALHSEQQEYVDKVCASSDILMSVINDILDFSKIEAGKLSLENISFSPTKTIENIIDAVTIKANEKNLNVHCVFKGKIPDKMLGDPVRLSQILLNLANNAVKFTHHGAISFEVNSQKKDNQQFMIIKIHDTGIGIPVNKVDKIFENFSQAEEDTTRTFGGTGLGLSIAKQLTNLMKGEISVQSTEGQGSCFCVEIPINQSNSDFSAKTKGNIQFDQLLLCHLDNKAFFNLASLSLISNKVIVKNDIDMIQPFIDAYTKKNNGNIKSIALLFTTKKSLSDENIYMLNNFIKVIENVRIITDTEPKKHFNYLSNLWPNKVIHQPITPSKLSKLYSNFSDTEKSPRENEPVEQLPQFNAHLLLVEDNAINQAVAGKILKSFGITFEIAEDGEQAVRKIENSADYDLIFMDVQMPVMDGYTATKIIRDKGFNDLIICGLSANAMRSDIDTGITVGMDDYITKPLTIAAIEKVLVKYIKHLER